jgi:hypothetical protein
MTYADECLERAGKATEGKWEPNNEKLFIEGYATLEEQKNNIEFIAHARTDVPELARRLKLSIQIIRQVANENPELSVGLYILADELEAPLEGK